MIDELVYEYYSDFGGRRVRCRGVHRAGGCRGYVREVQEQGARAGPARAAAAPRRRRALARLPQTARLFTCKCLS